METNAEITTLAEAVEADAKAGEPSVADSAPAAAVGGTSEDTSNWTEKAQKRYDELTRKAYEALGERDRERYQREASEARAKAAEERLAALEKAKTSEVAPQETFPTLEQCGYDEAKYQAAVATYFADLAEKRADARVDARLSEAEAKKQAEESYQSWATREAELIKSKPDYLEKVKNASALPISKEVQSVLLGHELGPQIALHMVDNAEASRAIMRMPLQMQLIEVGRISAKLEAAKAAPPKPVVSQAPAPVSKVDGEGSVRAISSTDPDSYKLSDEEWVKAETARMKRKQQRRAASS